MLVGFLSFRLVGELASVLSKTVAMVSSMMGLASGWSNSLAAILFLLPWIFFLGYLYRRCQDIGGAQAIPLSWILDKRPSLSAMLVALVFGSIYALGQGVTIIYYRTLSTLSGAELSSFHLTQTMMGLGLSCFLLVGGTLAIHRLRRRSV